MKYAFLAVMGVLIGVTSGQAAGAEDTPGRLERIVKSGDYSVANGDVIEIAVTSNPSTGPNNPASNLKVEVGGTGVLKKIDVVFVPPARQLPGAPGELRAYLLTDGTGDATVKVTPISGTGRTGETLEFKIKVSAR